MPAADSDCTDTSTFRPSERASSTADLTDATYAAEYSELAGPAVLGELKADQVRVIGDRRLQLGATEVLSGGDVLAPQI